MHIGIPAEIRGGETRVAATPETVKKFTAKEQHVVLVQSGAGAGASIPDEAYQEAGATIVADAASLYAQSQIILKVRGPEADELALMKKDVVLLGLLSPHQADGISALTSHGLTAFSMEKLPRISRAQSMDVLSSQANIAGYKAVIMAADVYHKFFPMLMTAAGTVKAARVLVLGAGVAGLQAIATAKRLGAVVEAFDVRPAVKEQVESLGGKFVEVPLTDEEKVQALILRARQRGFDLLDDVALFIMNRGPRDMAGLCRVLDQLDQASLKAKRKLTIPFVKSELGW